MPANRFWLRNINILSQTQTLWQSHYLITVRRNLQEVIVTKLIVIRTIYIEFTCKLDKWCLFAISSRVFVPLSLSISHCLQFTFNFNQEIYLTSKFGLLAIATWREAWISAFIRTKSQILRHSTIVWDRICNINGHR